MGARDIVITEHGVPRPGPLRLVLAALSLLLLVSGTIPGREPTEASHVPLPTMHIDAVVSDNTYTEDPNFDLSTDDNALNLTSITPCRAVANGSFNITVPVDIVVQNAPELVYGDARLNLRDTAGNFLPSTMASIVNIDPDPYVDSSTSQQVGFLNLPYDTAERRLIFPASAFDDPQVGSNRVAAIRGGADSFYFSPDHPHAAGAGGEPYAVSDAGAQWLRVNISVKRPAANDTAIVLDLSASPTPGSAVGLWTGSILEDNVLPEVNLRDGALTVGSSSCPYPAVDTTSDSVLTACTEAPADCSLRGALSNVSADSSPNIITFDPSVFPSGSPATIALGSALPALSNTGDTIDGSGAGVIVDGVITNFTCVAISGTGNVVKGIRVRKCTAGIDVSGSGHTIGGDTAAERNVIIENGLGISMVSGPDSVVISGNYIGIGSDGSTIVGNGTGVAMNGGASNNTIGGAAAGERNVISGNSDGININSGANDSNTIIGNYIGTDAPGTLDKGNLFEGVLIQSGTGNTVGGSGGSRNVISGNGDAGVFIASSGVTTVKGNYIGTDSSGASAIGNTTGVSIVSGSDNNIIGGSAVADRNVISGNTGSGVTLSGAGTTGNTVEGNYIGTNAAGTAAIANPYGVKIEGGAQSNTIGGATAGERNIISGNTNYGIEIADSGTTLNTVKGNYIGTDALGTADLGNGNGGILITAATANTIGGTAVAERNIISGNNSNGVWISGETADGNIVLNNYIGVNVSGTGALANSTNGIAINNGADNNDIGGTTSSARNVISGNGFIGVTVASSGTTGNLVRGNYIGTNAAGDTALPNTSSGVQIDTGASGNTVGGTTAGERNVISGNSSAGVRIEGAGTTLNTVSGNYIGTNAAGDIAIANALHGVAVLGSADNNIVGGTTAGERNVISGNVIGVLIQDSGTTLNSVSGNYIGTNAAGTAAIANATDGVMIGGGAAGNTIGGTSAGDRNLISGNIIGVEIFGGGTTSNLIQGNYVGLDATGTADLGNDYAGVLVHGGATGNTIGGASAGARNVVSGNGLNGVVVDGASTTSNSLIGNYIGTDAAGTAAIANSTGVLILSGAQNNTIGGSAPGERNVISGNTGIGVEIDGGTSIVVKGNYIGVAADGTSALGNGAQGVRITDGSNSTIGTTSSGGGNVIAHNGTQGIRVAIGTGNSLRGNSIYDNPGSLGIDLGTDGVTANDGGDGDTGPNNLMNFPEDITGGYDGFQATVSGTLDTPSPVYAVVDVYSTDVADPSGNGEGRVHLGSATPDGSGAWTLIVSGAPTFTKLTATATDAAGNTSEFSTAFTPPVGPGMPLTAIVRQGETTPIGGTFSAFGSAQVPGAGGDVVFWALVSGGSASEAIFKNSGGTITKLVASGESTPIGGTFTNFTNVPVVNDSNDVVFWASFFDGAPKQGIFRRSSGGLITKLVAIGDVAPGGGTFTSFQSFAGLPIPVTNNLGDVSFWATRSVGGEGVFLYSGGGVSKVAAVADAAPDGGTFSTFGGAGYATIPIVTDTKQVTFRASTSGGPAQGVYIFDNGSLAKIAAAGDSTPLGGTYTGFGRVPSPNEAGQVAFFATMTGSSAGACSCGVFRKTGGISTKLLAGGDPGPIGVGGTINDLATGPIMNESGQVSVWAGIANGLGAQAIVRITNPVENVAAIGNTTPIGGTFSDFIDPSGFPTNPVVSNQGQVVFWGDVVGGSGASGIFTTQAPPPGEPVITQGPVAGAAAPGTNGGTYGDNFDLDINSNGRAVFANTVNGGTSGAGVFLFFAGSAEQDISLRGEPAPGGGQYDAFSPPVNNDNPAANNGNGLIVGQATTTGLPGQGLYLFFAGSPDEAVALKTQDATGGGTYDAFGDPAVNNANQIAATAEINGAQDGLFLFFAGEPVSNAQKLAAVGQTAPDSNGRTFLFFAGSPSINDAGRVTQRITLQGGAAGEGLYLFFAGQPFSTAQKLAATGDPVPGGGTFLFFAGSPAINSDGRVVAVANYMVGVEEKTGLFLFFAGQPGAPSGQPPIKLADLITVAPTGGTFTGFSGPVLTNGLNPEVVVQATTSLGGEGLFLFFAGSPVVKKVVALGDPIPNSDLDDEYGPAGPPPVFPFHAMNNGVQVVFVANVYQGATTQGVFLASLDSDNDGFIDYLDNCPILTNTDQQNTDSSLAAAGASVLGDGIGNACDTDDDNDQFSDTLEPLSGTNPVDNCPVGPGSGGDAWPPDVNSDGSVTGFDLNAVASVIGKNVPPGPARRNIAPDPPDGAITGADLQAVASRIGKVCA